jgi:hypothetical protein
MSKNDIYIYIYTKCKVSYNLLDLLLLGLSSAVWASKDEREDGRHSPTFFLSAEDTEAVQPSHFT